MKTEVKENMILPLRVSATANAQRIEANPQLDGAPEELKLWCNQALAFAASPSVDSIAAWNEEYKRAIRPRLWMHRRELLDRVVVRVNRVALADERDVVAIKKATGRLLEVVQLLILQSSEDYAAVLDQLVKDAKEIGEESFAEHEKRYIHGRPEAALTWGEISIRFVEHQSVAVSARKARSRLTHAELGFKDGRSPDAACQAWWLLVHLACNDGRISIGDKFRVRTAAGDSQVDFQKHHVSDLRARLSRHFQISSDPVPYQQSCGSWVVGFELYPGVMVSYFDG